VADPLARRTLGPSRATPGTFGGGPVPITREEMRRLRQAAERGWKVPDEIRTDALCRIAELLESPGLTPRDLASILRTLAAFDRTDMLDERLTLDRAKWSAARPRETVETAADLARQLLDAARAYREEVPDADAEGSPECADVGDGGVDGGREPRRDDPAAHGGDPGA